MGFSFQVRVYFEDTDFSGNVYHGAYIRFFERGRTEWLRARGIHHAALAEQGQVFAVHEMQVKFEKPAKIDDQLDVETEIKSMSAARIVLGQRILRDDQVLASAEVTVVLLTLSGRPLRLSPELRALS